VSSQVTRKLHLKLAEELHQRLRVKCALLGCTIQDFVAKLIAQAVSDVNLSTLDGRRKRSNPRGGGLIR
jgi:hypothetical protein